MIQPSLKEGRSGLAGRHACFPILGNYEMHALDFDVGDKKQSGQTIGTPKYCFCS